MNDGEDTNLTRAEELRLDSERGRVLVEESREIVVVLDAADRVIAASRRARESIEGLTEGQSLPRSLSRRARGGSSGSIPFHAFRRPIR